MAMNEHRQTWSLLPPWPDNEPIWTEPTDDDESASETEEQT